MRKQILVVMLGLSVVLSGCSSQSTESMLQEVKFSESDYNFDYNIEYVFNTKTKDVEKLAYEITIKTEGTASKATTKGSLEEINKEVKVELPEESKNAVEEGK